MSGAPQGGSAPTTKATTSDTKDDTRPLNASNKKPSTQLDEDDEFEDFPVEDWPKEDEMGSSSTGANASSHLWEESWDDDDTSDDFSVQLRQELKKTAK